jgi:hypothetical protein
MADYEIFLMQYCFQVRVKNKYLITLWKPFVRRNEPIYKSLTSETYFFPSEEMLIDFDDMSLFNKKHNAKLFFWTL